MSGKFHDLSFKKLPDGGIRLIQTDCGEDSVIDLHPWQLRAVTEHFGLVHPAPPADELSKKLAEQLCRTYRALTDDYARLTLELEIEWSRLDAFIDLMPDAIFPHHLWEERQSATEATKAASKPVASAEDNHSEFALTTQEVER